MIRSRTRHTAAAAFLTTAAIALSGCAAVIPGGSSAEAAPTAVASAPPVATPTPTSSAAPEASTTASATGSAVAAVETLVVKGRAPKTGYSRAQFGNGWIDVDRNGCDTRNDMLADHLTDLTMSGSCKVLSGTLADPYTATSVDFVYGGASEVDVDHVVALSDAWQKGAQKWDFAKRVAFANDPLNLQPTAAGANRSKGDGDAATWLPSNKAFRCEYVATQAAVKTKYGAWVTAAEQQAMLRVLSACPDQDLPAFGSQPTTAANTGGQSAPSASATASASAEKPKSTTKAPAAKPKPTSSAPAEKPKPATTDPRFRTCAEAIAAGHGPYRQGIDPEYTWYRDRDKDGVTCER